MTNTFVRVRIARTADPRMRLLDRGQPSVGSLRSKQIKSSHRHNNLPPHGLKRYKSKRYKCACQICRDAASAYARQRRRAKAEELWGVREPPYTSPEQAQAHIAWLRANGMGWRRIAHAAGVSESTISRLVGHSFGNESTRHRIRTDVQNRILTVRLTPAPKSIVSFADAERVTRKAQALVALGWSQRTLAQRLGLSAKGFYNILHGSSPMQVKNAEAIERLYRELHMTPGSNSRARAKALKLQWRPPLAWDDIDQGITAPKSLRRAARQR